MSDAQTVAPPETPPGPGTPTPFAKLPPQRQDIIRKNLATMQAKGAPDADIESYLRDVEHVAPVGGPTPEASSPGMQFSTLIGQGASLGFGKKILGGIDAANKMLPRALGGEDAPLADFGKNYAATRDRIGGVEEQGLRDHPIAGRATEVAAGALPFVGGQLLNAVNGVAPVASSAAGLGARVLRGAMHGAGYGAAAGAGNATGDATDYAKSVLLGGAGGALVGGALPIGGRVFGGAGGEIMDALNLRPDESRPLVMTRRFGGIGPTVEGTNPRAARTLAENLSSKGVRVSDMQAASAATDKPLTPMELGGTPARRIGRGLKTAVPEVEQSMRTALEPRADQAHERVTNDILDLTGVERRGSGFQTAKDLQAARAEQGRAGFGALFAQHPDPITDPAFLDKFNEIAQTETGKKALKTMHGLASDFRDPIGSIRELASAPEGIPPADWDNMLRLAKERGMPLPTDPTASPRLAPTLKQAHYFRMGLNEAINSTPEEGSGPMRKAARVGLKKDLTTAMSGVNSDYAGHLGQYADASDLMRANEAGQRLWKMSPDEAEEAVGQMSRHEQDVFRRAGVDATAQRINDGPPTVDKHVNRESDARRFRLLFPDDNSFSQFKERLQGHERSMAETNRYVLGGSPTADKFADVAGMAGMPVSEMVMHPTAVPGKLARMALRARMSDASGKTAMEQGRILTAGADGDVAARRAALDRMAKYQRPDGPFSGPGAASPPPNVGTGPTTRGGTAGLLERARTQYAPSWIVQPPKLPGPSTAGELATGQRAPLPESRRLPGRSIVGESGDTPLGPAIPTPSHRATPTSGSQTLGPGIPARGQTLDAQVAEEVAKIYRRNPEMAVSLTHAQQQRVEALVRAKLTGTPEPPITAPTFNFRRAIGLGDP